MRLAKFEVINLVGAMSLNATLNCSAFAEEHRSTAHYDKSSFVGLAFRPPDEKCVVEIYSSGRANLPGSQSLRDMILSTYRMLPALLKYSSASSLLALFPEKDRQLHSEDRQQGACGVAEDRAVAWGEAEPDESDAHGFGNGSVDPSLLEALPL